MLQDVGKSNDLLFSNAAIKFFYLVLFDLKKLFPEGNYRPK